MPKKNPTPASPLRLITLEIENFKAIDHLTLNFQPPLMPNDPNIHVIGSKNGVGKTSIFEALSLLYVACYSGMDFLKGFSRKKFPDWIRAGNQKSRVSVTFSYQDQSIPITLELCEDGTATLIGTAIVFDTLRKQSAAPIESIFEQTFSVLKGTNTDPLILPGLMYFHSYRKVQQGRTPLGMVTQPTRTIARYGFEEIEPIVKRDLPVSVFKMEILRLLMAQGGLFENVSEDEDSKIALATLNKLVERFAHGKLEKLRSLPDSTVDFLITPTTGATFSFDGLSSGQKEMISTLFLIWKNRNNGNIVLLDEPELHLNAEWHKPLVRSLNEFGPSNQYILATHSEDVFDAVDAEHRVLLEPNPSLAEGQP